MITGAIHTEIVDHPSASYGRDLADDDSWHLKFTPQDLAEIDAAVRLVARHELSLDQVGRGSFPLPTLGPKLLSCLKESAMVAASS